MEERKKCNKIAFVLFIEKAFLCVTALTLLELTL